MKADLASGEWNQILAILAEQPWRIAQPLIARIEGQLNPSAELVPIRGGNREVSGDDRPTGSG